ncbi:MAG TPA: M20/M25/M40 family metallo-hydrolase [Lacunisphaera sp.]|nr:M20/M25/M40 family metallo-hydrolase [Lacunisphaera sp.]
MRRSLIPAIVVACSTVLAACAASAPDPAPDADAAMLRRLYDAALTESPAYGHLGELVTRFPGRLSGSRNLEGAVQWAKGVLEKQGVDRLELQPVMVPHWERGAPERVNLLRAGGPVTTLTATALGGSVPTPAGGLKAEVIELPSLEAVNTADVTGKIVFFNGPMDPKAIIPGDAYGDAYDQRTKGPAEAARRGAIGVLTRSLTHALNDVPHTGATRYADDAPRIPAAALSTLAANRLSAALKEDPKLQVEFTINSKWFPDAQSYNVIGEIRGAEHPEKVIVVGGHLDSWDITPGAHDDGTGVVQSIEVLRLLQAAGYKPRHTVRCVLFTSEENSVNGGKEYARVAIEKKEEHLLALETDTGGFQPRRFQLGNKAGDAHVRAARWLKLFEPYNLAFMEAGEGGADVGPLLEKGGWPVGEMLPDSQLYFDYHHTTIDTLDKVNPREMQLGAAALAALVYLVDQHGL